MKRTCAALIAGLALALSLAGQVPASGSAVVKSIDYVKTAIGLEVNIHIDGDFVHQDSVLFSPNRLVIDIAPAQRTDARPFYEVNAFGVTTIRANQLQSQMSRVILDFSGTIPDHFILRTDTGLTIKLGPAAKPSEKPAPPAVTLKPVQEKKPFRETAETSAESEGPALPPGFFNTTAGFTIGTYKSSSERFDEVYGSETGIQFGINMSRTLLYYRGFQFDVSGELRTFSRTGEATLSGDEARFSMTPITLAGRVLYQTKYAIPFLGAGADWYSYSEESALADTSGSASGYHFQAGVYLVIPNLDFLRVKLYYKFTKITATENEIEVPLGGPEYGIGLSFVFNILPKASVIIQ